MGQTAGPREILGEGSGEYSPFVDQILLRAVCVIRTSYRVFYTVWRFWRFLFSSNLRGLQCRPRNRLPPPPFRLSDLYASSYRHAFPEVCRIRTGTYRALPSPRRMGRGCPSL